MTDRGSTAYGAQDSRNVSCNFVSGCARREAGVAGRGEDGDGTERMEKDGEVDAWVMALPNGACKPFVDAIDRGANERTASDKSVIVDLSADFRFEKEWVYGLPGKPQ